MKVLFLHCAYQQSGGEDTVVREEIKLLRGKGVEVALMPFNNEGGWRALLQLPFNVGAYRRTLKAIRAEKPDVIHVHNIHFGASPSVLYAVRRSGVPGVMTLHNYRLLCPSAILYHDGALFERSLEQRFPWAAIKRGVYRNSRLLTAWVSLCYWLHRALGTWRIPEKYLALTPHAEKLFLRSRLGITENKISVKPNFSTFTPVPALRGTHFLYAGRLTPEKGLRLLLRVFAVNRWPLRIAGDGPLADEVRAYTQSFPHISYLGALRPEELAVELGSATALVFPSQWYEGMPLTIIEAFACGTPVIASRLGAMETMISDGINGLHFAEGDEHDLTRAIRHWQSLPPEARARMEAQASNTYAKFYHPDKNAAQLLSLYRTLIRADRPDSMVSAALEWSA